MQYKKINFIIFTNWFIKSICIIGLTAIITLISLPILSQEDILNLLALFQPNKARTRTVENDLVATLEQAGIFQNFLHEIETASLTEKLEEEQFKTLLAFTDEAFDDLPVDIYDKFKQPENRKKVLRYHLIDGQVTREDLQRGKIVTVEGNIITVSSHNENNKFKVILCTGITCAFSYICPHDKSSDCDRLKYKNANAKFPSTLAENGVIIEIDRVLLPPDF